MKRKIIWRLCFGVLLFSAILLAGCDDSDQQGNRAEPEPEPRKDPSSVTFAVFSDPHLYDPSLGTEGPAFEAYIFQDRKMIRESRAILNTALNSIRKIPGLDFVIISGDLTKDGERINHELFADLLRRLESDGLQVYLVPGNHDVNNPHAFAYSGNDQLPVASVSPEDFASIYADFGYGEALYRDADSLSYIAEPSPGFWLFALDSTDHDANQILGRPVISGRFTQSTLHWIVQRLDEAKAKEKQVIGMMHHGLLEHFSGQSRIFPGSEYVIDDWEHVSRNLAEAGLQLVFTGHYHAQDITGRSWEIDGEVISLIDVETGSLVAYPVPYRIGSLDRSGRFTVESRYVTEIDDETGGLPFTEYAADVLRGGVYDLTFEMGTEPADQGGYGLTPEQAKAIAPLIADAVTAHYRGDENPSPITQAILNTYSKSNEPTMQMLGQTLSSLWRDLPPADISVSLELGPDTFLFDGESL